MADRFAAAVRCDTCGSDDLHGWVQRADGLAVLRCGNCSGGVVEQIPGDLHAIYAGDYYSADAGACIGYSDYAFTAEHSVGWAAALADALRPDGGAALDVGCADGLLLTKLSRRFTRRAGIEMNPAMAKQCQDRGLEVLANDISDPAIDRHFGAFELVTSIAVFEHVPEFRRAVERAVALTTPGGVLLFEVPLMSEIHDNSVWLASSLEHLYYPTLDGLQYLFAEVLDLSLHGQEIYIDGYGSNFVGVTSRDFGVARSAGDVLGRVLADDGIPTTASETRARVHARLMHAARSGAAELDSLAALPLRDVTRATLRRMSQVWSSDRARRDDAEAAVAELRGYLSQVEVARDDAQKQLSDSHETAAAQRRLLMQVDEPQRARAAAESQAADWERQAHLTHAHLEAILASSTWRIGEPVRTAITFWRRGRQRAQLLRNHVNARRTRAIITLARQGDLRTIRQRLTAINATAAAAAGMSSAIERGPRVATVLEPWPIGLPLVSVVIVCFNYGKFVQEAVDSALGQTFGRLEVIVVDGGSNDQNTVEALDLLERAHPEVRVLRREGRHLVGDNRNHGISAARGRYICCLDADDLLHPIYIELAAYLLECHNYDVVSTSTRTFGLREETFGLLPRPDLDDMLLANNVSTVGVFRRTLWERSGGFHDTGIGPEHIHEDWKFWVRLAALGARILNVTGQELFLYRVHGTHSLSNLVGTPTMGHQRDAIAEFNSDLVNEETQAESRVRREELHEVQNAFRNVVEPDVEGRITILVTMPFLIVGGAERLISQITSYLARRDFRIIIVTTVPVSPEFGDTSAWFVDATTEIFHLPRLLDASRWENFIDYLIVTKHVDVLWQAGSTFAYAMLPALRAKYARLRVLDLLFNTIGHAASNRTHRGEIDLIMVENAEVERWLLDRGEDPARIVRAESGVDLQAYVPVVPRSRTGRLRVGFSGRFSEEKDPLAFLDIAAGLQHRGDFDFVMTGAGPLEAKVRSRLNSSDLRGKVDFLGLVEDGKAHLASLDVLVLPSRLDGRPVVVLEALALGIPVVASEVGALPELVLHGETGFLCRPRDTGAFVACLSRLADDPELLEDMSKAARRFAENSLDARVMLDVYEKTLLNLVRPAKAVPARTAAGPTPSRP